MKALLLTLITLTWTTAAYANPTQDKLRSEVFASRNKLGAMETWQAKVFEEEILPNYARFIRDYRVSGAQVSADVDLDAIRKYMTFYAPTAFKNPTPKIAAWVKVDPACEKCKEVEPALKALAKGRLERRGFVVVWPTGDVAVEKGTVGSFVITAKDAPVDTLDTVHADEKHYLVNMKMTLTGAGNEVVQEDKLELQDGDSFETAVSRLMITAISNFGNPAILVQLELREDGPDETLIEIGGVKSYAQYGKLKERLISFFKETEKVSARKLARGHAAFGVKTDRTPEQLKSALSGLRFEGGRLAVMETTEKTIKAVIQ